MSNRGILAFAVILAGCGMQPGSPLIGAARSGDTKGIATLVAAGVDPNQRWGVND
jgi:hypothetical protein